MVPGAIVEPAEIAVVDWVARFREGFRPFRAGRFRIVPAWAAPIDLTDVIVVEPGRAFGTGTHETTRLCLTALEDLASRGPLGRVLDVGTGTGLLGVAAARLGARSVTAIDNDGTSIEAAVAHARLNDTRLDSVLGDGGKPFRPGAFDVVLANLTAPFLLERRAELGALVAEGGALVLSGLLGVDVPTLRAAYDGLGRCEETNDGEWAALRYRRQ
jgi:ribosomal protein L11 methyltransferase